MLHRTLAVFMCFMPLALTAYAQPAINSGANTDNSTASLPLRNVQIEVRQVQREDGQRSGVQGNTRVDVGTNGLGGQGSQISINGQLQVEQRQSRQSNSATQYALVLNGRSTRISLGTSTPLRLMQTYFRNGALFMTPGTVMLQTNTGFVATPRWDGSDRVELEISAQQAVPAGTASRGLAGVGISQTSSTSSTLVLPLGEWTTVAQSEQDSSGASSGLGGTAEQSARSGYDVQVRLTIK